ncbi:MAG TPA: protein kinase [Candidatus Angelobacter sp.]|nr:protein kinase [Candidatus Angelobacter sp.]
MGSLQISGPADEHAAAHAQPSTPASELKSAFNGRYEILSELGRGAMGVVYKAQDRVIGRTVALKTIAVGREAPDHDEVIERLKSEAKAAGSLDHPNIITIYDVGHDGDRVYLSMQYVEGSTLAAMLDGKNLRPGQLTLLNYAEQICNAVAFAHERGVVHRDLKPSNLMLTPQGQIKVLDFGIAKKGDASLTQSGMVVGTPSYMAPEQATGREVDQRSDIFSLGAVLYELFTGKKAFHAESVTAVLYRVVHDAPEAPSAINPAIPSGVEAAIRRALEKDPNLRFQNCVELRDMLRKEAVLLRTASAKVLVKPLLESGKHTRLVSGKGKHGRALPVLLAAGFILLASAVVVWPQRAKIPKLMRFISYVQKLGRHQPSNDIGARTSASSAAVSLPAAGQSSGLGPNSPGSNSSQPPATVSTDAATKPEAQAQDAAPVPLQPVPGAQSAGDVTAAANGAHAPAPAAAPASASAAPTAATKDSKSETESPAAASAEEPTADRAAVDISTEPTDTAAVSKHVRPATPPAPSVVEGFTRKDIPDLLRKADAAAGSGDYRSAVYEYDIVLRLDRVNARAREGLRRSREAEKERR